MLGDRIISLGRHGLLLAIFCSISATAHADMAIAWKDYQMTSIRDLYAVQLETQAVLHTNPYGLNYPFPPDRPSSYSYVDSCEVSLIKDSGIWTLCISGIDTKPIVLRMTIPQWGDVHVTTLPIEPPRMFCEKWFQGNLKTDLESNSGIFDRYIFSFQGWLPPNPESPVMLDSMTHWILVLQEHDSIGLGNRIRIMGTVAR